MYYYICACAKEDKGGGIYSFALSEEGKLCKTGVFPCDRPMYSVSDGKKSYILLREGSDKNGKLLRVTAKNGICTDREDMGTTGGRAPCHLAVRDSDIYVVNYMSGNVCAIGGAKIDFSGKGYRSDRQNASHTHAAVLSPSEKYVLVTDLGLDKIYVFDRALTLFSSASVPPGNGARHMVFSHDGRYLYVVNELSATVSVFLWEEGRLTLLSDVSSEVPPDILGKNTAAAIRLSRNGQYLYISNRGEDTIAVFRIENGRELSLIQKASVAGQAPRDFILTADERFLLSANQISATVTVFRMEKGLVGEMTDRVSLPCPICVMEK